MISFITLKWFAVYATVRYNSRTKITIERYSAQVNMSKLSTLSLNLGKQLRLIRQEKSLSLSQSAKLTGVSKAMLGQIERGESSPTVELLWKLAQGLEISFTSLLHGQPVPDLTLHSSASSSDMHVKPVFHMNESSDIEMFDICLDLGCVTKREPHQQGVKEYIWVLEGEMEVLFNNQWHLLEQGQTIQFDADQPHGYRALMSRARFSNIISYK